MSNSLYTHCSQQHLHLRNEVTKPLNCDGNTTRMMPEEPRGIKQIQGNLDWKSRRRLIQTELSLLTRCLLHDVKLSVTGVCVCAGGAPAPPAVSGASPRSLSKGSMALWALPSPWQGWLAPVAAGFHTWCWVPPGPLPQSSKPSCLLAVCPYITCVMTVSWDQGLGELHWTIMGPVW